MYIHTCVGISFVDRTEMGGLVWSQNVCTYIHTCVGISFVDLVRVDETGRVVKAPNHLMRAGQTSTRTLAHILKST